MVDVRKKEGESSNSLIFRFSKKIRQSGILAESRKRRFTKRAVNRRSRRLSAVFRAEKKAEVSRLKKLGLHTGR